MILHNTFVRYKMLGDILVHYECCCDSLISLHWTVLLFVRLLPQTWHNSSNFSCGKSTLIFQLFMLILSIMHDVTKQEEQLG